MKMTFDIDCTPEEARRLFGLPDVSDVNQMIVEAMTKRAEENMDHLSDPEQLMANFINASGTGFNQFQSMMANAMSAASGDKTNK